VSIIVDAPVRDLRSPAARCARRRLELERRGSAPPLAATRAPSARYAELLRGSPLACGSLRGYGELLDAARVQVAGVDAHARDAILGGNAERSTGCAGRAKAHAVLCRWRPMSDKNRPRRLLLVLAALVLPAATCGVAPALTELVGRVNLLETRAARFEAFVANARLPLMLMDEHDRMIGTVLEYNDMYQYASVLTAETGGHPAYRPWSPPEAFALATIQYPLPSRPPLILEANRAQLLTPKNGRGEYLFFESEDCTGRPWAGVFEWDELGGTLFSRGWIGTPGTTLYALSPGTPTERIRWNSYLKAVGLIGVTQTCSRWSDVGDLAPFEPVDDLTQYTPPFRVVDPSELWGW
jgi:hypothetical protein